MVIVIAALGLITLGETNANALAEASSAPATSQPAAAEAPVDPVQAVARPPARHSCLEPLADGKPVVSLSLREKRAVLEHSCSRWSAAPVKLRRVRVVEELPADGDGVGRARVEFDVPEQDSVQRAVAIGDEVSINAQVVGLGPGIVLFDIDGSLAAATDGRPIDEWRMIYHSRFGVPTPSKSGGGGGGKGAVKRPGKTAKAPHKAKRVAKPAAKGKKKK